MRTSLLSVMFVASLLSIPMPQKAAATPVTTAALDITPAVVGRSIEEVYYYRGGYYPYRYGGMYWHHRYYRYGRWHYY
jgi:hypothetical protein